MRYIAHAIFSDKVSYKHHTTTTGYFFKAIHKSI